MSFNFSSQNNLPCPPGTQKLTPCPGSTLPHSFHTIFHTSCIVVPPFCAYLPSPRIRTPHRVSFYFSIMALLHQNASDLHGQESFIQPVMKRNLIAPFSHKSIAAPLSLAAFMILCISCSFSPGIIGPIIMPSITPALLSSLITFNFCLAVVVRGFHHSSWIFVEKVIDTIMIQFFLSPFPANLCPSVSMSFVNAYRLRLNSLHTSRIPLVSLYCSAGW